MFQKYSYSLHMTTQYFDLAILDIMGVDGYKLLKIAVEQEIIAVMLTAHALSPEDTVKSFRMGLPPMCLKRKCIILLHTSTIYWRPKSREKAFCGYELGLVKFMKYSSAKARRYP